MSDTCRLCPRECNVDRTNHLGYCRSPKDILLARAALHRFEEPVISGTGGSGTIFFCGCNLGCVYCQNSAISHGDLRNTAARAVSKDELAKIMLRLKNEGAHNINLVTPTHYSDAIAEVLLNIKEKLGIPVIYNCGGYESVESLRRLKGLIDIYMPDFKYFSPELSAKYSAAPDYCLRAVDAITEMYDQVEDAETDDKGIMKKGLLIRHLVLPGGRKDSVKILKIISQTLPIDKIFISIMRQYTPDFTPDEFKELKRRLTSFEYDFVLSEAEKMGFYGFSQDKESATQVYTPNFSLKTF